MSANGPYAPSPARWVRDQVELYEGSGGASGTTMRGMPVIIVITRGVRSGKVRKVPLMRVEHNGEYAAVASQGGAPKNPNWYYNLVADPNVEVRDGTVVRAMTAREVTSEEKAIWWKRCVAAFPDYAKYQARAEREIPVFVLTPLVDAASGGRAEG
jgi:deazaflavin-dependent oxidoreductase (nitroreductase family)